MAARAAELQAAAQGSLADLLSPSLSVAARIDAVAAAQGQLSLRIQALTAELASSDAALTASPHPTPDIAHEARRLKECRARMTALHKSLVATRSRLGRVHESLRKQAAFVEGQAEKAAAALDADLHLDPPPSHTAE